ncbi:MAG TPA: (Fe-S)-binding protein [Gammaproteobacteria bacterium]|nr:(Fe-S)-binding protein [Gammaproteobacteria bacterium]
MLKIEFETPPLGELLVTPPVQPDAMAHSRPFVAKPEHQQSLGFPGELVDNWQDAALEKMGELLGKYRSLPVFLDSCVPKNMPVARQDLLRKVYRRYFTLAGKWFPRLVGAVELSEDVINDWYSYYHQCSECRRCSVYCPFGIDTAEITMAGREILASIGVGQKYSNEIIGKVHIIGNNLGLPEPALANTLEGLEEEVEEDINVPVKFPLDQHGAEVLLVTPSADFFAEPHVDGLIGYAKVFHQAGISWTLSSYASEAANFGIFIGNYENMQKVAQRIRQAAIDLGVKRIVVGECGHAWRVAYSFWNTLIGPFDFLDPAYPVPQHICEFTYDLLQGGALKLDPKANDDKVVTFHDSCNVSRGSRLGNVPGGQFTIPRELIRSACSHFVDMAPETIHEHTFCCGGGGGLLTDDLIELRVKGALPRAQALQQVIEQHGVTHMAAICAICKSQFSKVLPYYGMEMDMIISVHQLIGDALVFDSEH